MNQRVLVVDDEPLARQRVLRMLAKSDDIEVVGEASSGQEAIAKAIDLQPDLLLLDIEMPDLTGLEVAAQLEGRAAVVFVTAYHEYAIEAFEAEAVDYLVKPVSQERLRAALERAYKRTPAKLDGLHRSKLAGPQLFRVVASHQSRVEIFDAREITRFWARDKYTWFHVDGREQITEERLDSLENRLSGAGFVRLHRSELVRLDAIRSIERDAAGTTVGTSDGQCAQVSRRKVTTLKKLLGV
ncbi:MAG: LytTR family DNA-binding domain-containing protein [Myxococcota bacterium]